MTTKIDHNETLDAVWCVDSETGIETLLHVPTGKVLAQKIDGKIVEPKS